MFLAVFVKKSKNMRAFFFSLKKYTLYFQGVNAIFSSINKTLKFLQGLPAAYTRPFRINGERVYPHTS